MMRYCLILSFTGMKLSPLPHLPLRLILIQECLHLQEMSTATSRGGRLILSFTPTLLAIPLGTVWGANTLKCMSFKILTYYSYLCYINSIYPSLVEKQTNKLYFNILNNGRGGGNSFSILDISLLKIFDFYSCFLFCSLFFSSLGGSKNICFQMICLIVFKISIVYENVSVLSVSSVFMIVVEYIYFYIFWNL